MLIAFTSRDVSVSAKGEQAARSKAIAELRNRASCLFKSVSNRCLPAGAELHSGDAQPFRLLLVDRPRVATKCGCWIFRARVVVNVAEHHEGPALDRLAQLTGEDWGSLLRTSIPKPPSD